MPLFLRLQYVFYEDGGADAPVFYKGQFLYTQLKKEERTIRQANECNISLTPSLAATWAPKGETPTVKGERRCKRLHIFAIITVKVQLMWDNASIHKDRDILSAITQTL